MILNITFLIMLQWKRNGAKLLDSGRLAVAVWLCETINSIFVSFFGGNQNVWLRLRLLVHASLNFLGWVKKFVDAITTAYLGASNDGLRRSSSAGAIFELNPDVVSTKQAFYVQSVRQQAIAPKNSDNVNHNYNQSLLKTLLSVDSSIFFCHRFECNCEHLLNSARKWVGNGNN